VGKMATRYEMQTIYSLTDLYYLDEVLNLKEEAEYLNSKKK
jgi:hypothetical protein